MITQDRRITLFNKKKEYKEFIAPLIEQLKMRCEASDIPMFITCCVESKENDTLYVNDAVCTGLKNIELFNDHIEKHLCVENGFEVRIPGVHEQLPDSFLEYMDDAELEMNKEDPIPDEDEEFVYESLPEEN